MIGIRRILAINVMIFYQIRKLALSKFITSTKVATQKWSASRD